MKEKGKEALSPVQEKVAELQEQKRLEMLKKGEYVGAFRVHRFYAQFARYMELIEMIRLIENNAQEAYGMDVRTFCKEILIISYETLNNQRDLLKDTQPHVIAAIKALGYSLCGFRFATWTKPSNPLQADCDTLLADRHPGRASCKHPNFLVTLSLPSTAPSFHFGGIIPPPKVISP